MRAFRIAALTVASIGISLSASDAAAVPVLGPTSALCKGRAEIMVKLQPSGQVRILEEGLGPGASGLQPTGRIFVYMDVSTSTVSPTCVRTAARRTHRSP